MIASRRAVYALGLVQLFAAADRTYAQSGGVMGYWQEPGGSVLHVASCGVDNLCLTLVKISATAPKATDGENPDPKLRDRPLCGVVIGTGFHLEGPDKAEGGKLYDPKSGKTYHGAMRSEGGVLHLRGYIGFKAFGRSEEWKRTNPTNGCPARKE